MELQGQIFDVGRDDFEEKVIKGSQERVVVVDFWAPWCGPCRTLGPILEEVITQLGAGVALAKVNVDENQELAAAFRVQGIPAVKVVKDGQLVHEFTGAQPREQILAALEPLVGEVTAGPANEFAEQAEQLAAVGDLEGAAQAYEQVLKELPENGPALLGLARIRLQQGKTEALQELVDLIDETQPQYQQAQALLRLSEFSRVCAESGGRGACAQKILADPDDLDARHGLACCAAVAGDHEEALKEWLTIVQRNSQHAEGAAKEAMVAVFHLLGRDNELVAEYQRRLYQALY